MAWLLRDGEVLAALEVATTFGAKMTGLIGRSSMEGALLLERARSVHTIGMRFPIDVAFCDRDMVVFDTIALAANRLSMPRLRARFVLEARAGAFERWRLLPGDALEIRR